MRRPEYCGLTTAPLIATPQGQIKNLRQKKYIYFIYIFLWNNNDLANNILQGIPEIEVDEGGHETDLAAAQPGPHIGRTVLHQQSDALTPPTNLRLYSDFGSLLQLFFNEILKFIDVFARIW